MIKKATEIMRERGPLLRMEARTVGFVGDTHTALDVTDKVIKHYFPLLDKLVFLGDYVDRGDTGVENLVQILSIFIKNPEKVIVLRGNHESPLTNLYYGFYSEVTKKFGSDAYVEFEELFSSMPYAALVNKVLCVHGGLSNGIRDVEEIEMLPSYDINPDDPQAFQILWNDPREEVTGFVPSERGDGAFLFGRDVTEEFLTHNDLTRLIRGHEVADGFRFDMDGKVITVFSSRYHHMSAGMLVMSGQSLTKIYL
ncbi:serine/threonine phosphatase [Sulfodiicoccus acidiphilus]|uniref:Serine/threonine phosphatase n=1 Tax=Sulfodiicoccus acidiphilus TaxID=1670455 RepID=A0A348B6Y3_9CREN|nr:serine/threonine phosphatase [Sulfodiicoccus acidiphilus]GGU03270.1 serine/threonine phosphatase [Sulfodiicoccus acidiphilus]